MQTQFEIITDQQKKCVQSKWRLNVWRFVDSLWGDFSWLIILLRPSFSDLHFHLIENNYSRFIKCRCVFSLGHDEIVERIYSFQRSTLSKWSRLMFTRDYRKISIALQLSCKFVNYSGHSLWNPKYANIISFALFFFSQKLNFITNDVFLLWCHTCFRFFFFFI